MKEIQAQIRDTCPLCKQGFGQFLIPFDDVSRDELKNFKLFQIVSAKLKGIKKERSMLQLGTYWACCTLVADNTENKLLNTKARVDFHCRVETHFVDPDLIVVRKNGDVVFQYKSIAFKNLEHIEACRYFDRAFEIMADLLGVTPEKLVEMAKERMG